MVDADVILAKVATVERCLARIDEVTRSHAGHANLAALDDFIVADAVVLNLQRATQACIDMAHHAVADRGLGLPASLKEGFTLLERAHLLDATLAGQMRAMVGFRNVAVHAYEDIDPAILHAIVARHLGDLRAFCRVALQLAGLA